MWLLGPLPVGLEDAQIQQVLVTISWRGRFLVPQPKNPSYYIIAAEAEPTTNIIPYESHDILIKELPDKWTRETKRSKSMDAPRFNPPPQQQA